MKRAVVLGMAVLGLACGALAAHADEWSHTYAVTGKPMLDLKADNAAVTVEPGNTGQVSVDVTTDGPRIPGDIRIEENQTGNDITIKVKQEHHRFEFTTGTVAVNVRVPEAADLEVKTGNGKVGLAGIRGDLRMETGNGAIDARGLEGEISLRTGNGRVEARGVTGRLEAHTGNGEMVVSGRFTALTLESGQGSIEATAEAGSQAAAEWSLTSGAGSITLHLPKSLSGELDASTGVGSISLDFPASLNRSFTGSSAQAKLGAGGERVRIRTGVGDIRVARTSA